MELEMNCLTSRIVLKKVCSSKCQFYTKICATSRLVCQVHMMAGQNIKKKYLMCQIPIKMLKQLAIPNSSLYNLKIYSSEGCRKTSQRWIICMYLHINSKYLNFQPKILLQILSFWFDWWILLLLTLTIITQAVIKLMIARPLKTLYIVLHFVLTNYHMYFADWLV